MLAAFINGADDHAAVKEGRAALKKMYTADAGPNLDDLVLKKAARTTKKRQKEVQDVTKSIMKNIKARNAAVLTKEEHELIKRLQNTSSI